MIIYDSFYISGFTRIDKGEAGAVFVRYGKLDKRTPILEDAHLNYGGADMANFILSVPPKQVVKCAIVRHTSKNSYSAMVYDEKRIEYFSAPTLDGLRRVVADFFGV